MTTTPAAGTSQPDVHVKTIPGDPSRVTAEAAGLAWLASAEATGGVRVARVLGTGAGTLRLERIRPAGATEATARSFGRALAATHASGAAGYGAPPPGSPRGWIAELPLAYGSWSTFGPFYAQARIEPYTRMARDRGTLSAHQATVLDALCQRLADGDQAVCGPPEPAARLHGDLWSGNVLWSAAGAVLIDPAAHGGHRETDLAMLALFGLPYLEAVLAGYHAAAPLADGWRERVALHQVHPLLVHAVLFGGSYAPAAADAARRALRPA